MVDRSWRKRNQASCKAADGDDVYVKTSEGWRIRAGRLCHQAGSPERGFVWRNRATNQGQTQALSSPSGPLGAPSRDSSLSTAITGTAAGTATRQADLGRLPSSMKRPRRGCHLDVRHVVEPMLDTKLHFPTRIPSMARQLTTSARSFGDRQPTSPKFGDDRDASGGGTPGTFGPPTRTIADTRPSSRPSLRNRSVCVPSRVSAPYGCSCWFPTSKGNGQAPGAALGSPGNACESACLPPKVRVKCPRWRSVMVLRCDRRRIRRYP
jgi:hypothetical protein